MMSLLISSDLTTCFILFYVLIITILQGLITVIGGDKMVKLQKLKKDKTSLLEKNEKRSDKVV